jgi:hypothetical protein
MARKSSPTLSVMGDDPGYNVPQPPVPLGPVGIALWSDVLQAYMFDDAASYTVLAQACSCADRAERLRQLIDKDGEVLWTKTGIRSHPALRDEVQNRALCCRLLGKLGLDLEPTRPSQGRPPGYSPQLAGKAR